MGPGVNGSKEEGRRKEGRKRKKRNLWSFRNDLCYTSYWSLRICSLSTSYVHSWYGCRYSSLFYNCYYDYCSTYRD